MRQPTPILDRLNINAELTTRILTGFIRDSITKAGMSRAVIGLSGGIDSALSAYLCARALGNEMGTSNKTEFLLGYSTIYGDSGVALHPIADLYKYQVRQLARHLGVPPAILNKPPSADLWVGQTDEDELGFTYDAADQVLFLLVDERYTVAEVAAEGFDRDFVDGIWERVKANHYKRTMPNVAKISKRSIGHDFLYLRDYTGRAGRV